VTDESPGPAVEIDTHVAHAARVYDYLLGGSDNFAADREAARRVGELLGGLDNARAQARANRAFLGRAVRWLAAEAGIRQFLDIGTGIPSADNVHTIALRAEPDARVVSVDHDPVVLAHAHQLLRGGRDGATTYLQADLRGAWGPRGAQGLARGSYVAISHVASDIQPVEVATAAAGLGHALREPWVPRDRDAVRRLFAGLRLVEPGLVQVDCWRRPNGPAPTARNAWVNPVYAGIGRKG
jgi:hypothetical protein